MLSPFPSIHTKRSETLIFCQFCYYLLTLISGVMHHGNNVVMYRVLIGGIRLLMPYMAHLNFFTGHLFCFWQELHRQATGFSNCISATKVTT